MEHESTKRRIWVRLLQVVVILALVYFVGERVQQNWGEIKAYDWHINYLLLLLSLVVMLAALTLQSAVLSVIFGTFSRRVSFKSAFKIAYLSQLGRYIPGKIWQVFGMVYLAGKKGISKTEAITSFALAQVFTTPPAILAAMPLFFAADHSFNGSSSMRPIGIALAIVVLISLVIVFRSSWLRSILNFFLARLGKPSLEFDVEKKVGGKILIMYYIGWNLYGLAFYLFLISVSDFPTGNLVQAIGVFCAAYLVGYWSIIAPGGFGVREAVMVVFLSPYFGPGVAAAIAAFARIWSIVGEVIASVIALKVK